MPPLKLFLLGPPIIEHEGEPIKLNNRKAMALLSYIATTPQSHSRDSLVNLLWPNYDHSRGRTLLRVAHHALNKALKVDWSLADRQNIALNPNADLWVDVDEFHSLLAQSKNHGHPSSEVCPECLTPLTKAVALYRDDFLTGFSLRDSANFDDWQVSKSGSLHSEMTSALERLVHYLSEGESEPLEKAISYAQRWLEMDRSDEVVHRQLMELYAKAGRRSAALQQYEECVSHLKEKMGVSPEEATVRLYEAIKGNAFSTKKKPVVELPTHKSLDTPRDNLPNQLTSFIGRENEIVEISRLLKNTRLLTLTGVGGCGKTRLSLQVASNQVEQYPNGAWFVELASLSDPTLVAQEVALTLDIEEQEGRSFTDTISNYLRRKETLLVLDNCEHLIEACATLAENLLQACPRLIILATSREALGIAGEEIWNVSPLSTPDLELLPSLQTSDLSQFEALRLFSDRAATTLPTFEMAERNASTVAVICHRLDGIPLAIELAAARVKALSVDGIAERLEDRFDLLRGGSRTALPRQRTLEAMMDWSHDLLSEEERILFRRLSTFVGGCTLRGAEAVCNGSGDLGLGVLDGVTSLIEMLRNKKREGRVPQLNFFRLGKFEMKVP